MLCVGPLGASTRGSRSPKASGTMISAAQARMNSADCQPNSAISQASTGTIRNCPNEPAAAATPIAQERLAGSTWRAITP